MAKFCNICGNQIQDNVEYCVHCGSKVAADAKPAAPAVDPMQQYSQMYATPEKPADVVGTGAFFWLQLLFCIPFVGFICSIIFSFAPRSINLKHYSRSVMIWQILGIVIVVLCCVIFWGTFMAFLGGLSSTSYYY